MLFAGAVATADYSDLLTSEEFVTPSAEERVSLLAISDRLKAVEARALEVREALEELPPLQNAMQFDAYGYHSDYLPVLDAPTEEPRWVIDIETGEVGGALEFVMVPSMDRRTQGAEGYGFPKRFRVMTGLSVDDLEVSVDWSDADFPSPGRRPVYFSLPDSMGKVVRIEVYAGQVESGLEFFSLSRVYCIRNGEAQSITSVAASSSYEVLPYWSVDYLRKERSSLGLPLIGQTRDPSDFVLELSLEQAQQELTIEVDFGESRQHGWINLFPNQNIEGLKVPGYGFPSKLEVELVRESEVGSGEQGKSFPVEKVLANPGDNLLHLAWRGYAGRWLRLRASEFPVYQGQAVFALGEVEVERRGKRDSVGRPVSMYLDGEPLEVDTSALVDGVVGGAPILLMKNWFQGLAAAKPLERELMVLDAEEIALSERRQLFWRVLSSIVLLVSVVAVVAIVVLQIRRRRRELKKLRWRIARDLHDEVGSNLGSIALAAERLEADLRNSEVKEDLQDLSLLAREASASLRDVVWVIDQSEIRLPSLIQKLTERARRVLTGVDLKEAVDVEFPDYVVPLTAKRHLTMFYKEVINNCARHAGATEVTVVASIVEDALELSLQDNGCGFETDQPVDGWGLNSLQERAVELGGSLQIKSGLNQGTRISLRVPLAILLKKTDHAYKTSN